MLVLEIKNLPPRLPVVLVLEHGVGLCDSVDPNSWFLDFRQCHCAHQKMFASFLRAPISSSDRRSQVTVHAPSHEFSPFRAVLITFPNVPNVFPIRQCHFMTDVPF